MRMYLCFEVRPLPNPLQLMTLLYNARLDSAVTTHIYTYIRLLYMSSCVEWRFFIPSGAAVLGNRLQMVVGVWSSIKDNLIVESRSRLPVP